MCLSSRARVGKIFGQKLHCSTAVGPKLADGTRVFNCLSTILARPNEVSEISKIIIAETTTYKTYAQADLLFLQ